MSTYELYTTNEDSDIDVSNPIFQFWPDRRLSLFPGSYGTEVLTVPFGSIALFLLHTDAYAVRPVDGIWQSDSETCTFHLKVDVPNANISILSFTVQRYDKDGVFQENIAEYGAGPIPLTTADTYSVNTNTFVDITPAPGDRVSALMLFSRNINMGSLDFTVDWDGSSMSTPFKRPPLGHRHGGSRFRQR